MPPRSWTSPPTRREVTLLLFSFIVFFLSYNLETSLRVVGVNPDKLGSLSTLGLGSKDPGLDPDGRRPAAWRDELEKIIAGDWEWKEGEIAAVEHAQDSIFLEEIREAKASTYIYKAGAGRTAPRSATREVVGIGLTKGITVGQQFSRWEDKILETSVVAHVPGYTIFENLYTLNGTFYIVADRPSSVPPLGSIASSTSDRTKPPAAKDWRIISREEAKTIFGKFGGRVFGTSWLSTDPAESQDPYTLFSLYRAHNQLLSPQSATPFTSPSGLRIIGPGSMALDVTPPVRLIFPYVPTFSSPGFLPEDGNPKTHPPLRVKSYNGLHPHMLKAVFPTMGILYAEDWLDFGGMEVPYMLERTIVADSGAAERGRDQWTVGWVPPPKKPGSDELRKRSEQDETPSSSSTELKRADDDDDQTGKPVWAAPFVGFKIPEGWWSPVRQSLLSYLRLPPDSSISSEGKRKGQKQKPILTYVSMQLEPAAAGPRLRTEDHAALLRGLRKLEIEGVLGGVHVVRGNGSVEVWEQRMNAIAQSKIMLGPFGPHLADSIFMPAPLPITSTESTDSSPSQADPKLSAPVLMEFFPPGMFRRDQEYAVRSLGMRYIAWWNGRKFAGNSLPPVMGLSNDRLPKTDTLEILVDTDAVIQSVREEATRLSRAS
ncbi:hypothetical protein K474DRAFT_1707415 [Panus rudis PR-1116 ss-1]|nr:hypothetical protein K474DRAFT_1707415 [Panus rudis PR-1116 ss-1]